MDEQALHTAWNALNEAQRTNGVCNDPNDHAAEVELIGAIKRYEADSDLEAYRKGKRGE